MDFLEFPHRDLIEFPQRNLPVSRLSQLRQIRLGRYGVTVLSVLTALLLMLWLDAWIPMHSSPFLLFFAAIMVSAWYGGFKPGLVATALSALASNYFFLPPAGLALTAAEWERVGLFTLVAIMMSWLSGTRRQLVQELRRDRDWISAIVNAAGNLLVVCDRQGRIEQFNRACEQLTGYQFEEVRGKFIWDLLPPDDVAAVRSLLKPLPTKQTWREYQGTWLGKDGSQRTIMWSNAALFDEQGKIRSLIITGIDVSDRTQAERKLQETNRQLHALIQASPLAITVLDRQGRVNLWNPAAERIFGWQTEEVIGHMLPSVPADKQTEFLGNIATTLDGNLLNGQETVRQRQDGSLIDVSIWTAVVQSNGVDDRILSLIADVSDRKQTEAALKSMQERLTRLFESNTIGILFGDVDGNINQANDEFLRTIGYSRAALEAGAIDWIAITPPEYLPLDNERIREARQRGACTSYEKEYIRPDGSRVPVLVGYALMGEDRRQSVAFILDLSDRKALEAALQHKAEELAQANRLKDEFLAVLSHELRTPLNAILGWSTMLKSRTIDPTTTSRAVETIERNARLQTQLIDDILDVSKIIQGNLRLQPTHVHLLPLIEAAIATVSPAAAAKHICLEFGWPRQSECHFQLFGDPARLQQIFWNLLSNAIKFTPDYGQVEVQVTLVGTRPTYAEIRVTDTGSGISSEFLPFVFDRFRQADSTTTRHTGGLGLGLAIVRHLVELHGGTVWAASQGEGQGATFTVRLPLRIDGDEP